MGIKIDEEEAVFLEGEIKKITSRIIDCDIDCNGCSLKELTDVYNSRGVRMDKCDLLMLIEDNL